MTTQHEPTDWLPSYVVFPLFTAAEAAKLLSLTTQVGYEPATRLNSLGQKHVDRNHRRCQTQHHYAGSDLHTLVADRVLAHLETINGSYDFALHADRDALCPVVNVNRYDGRDRGHIGLHTDVGHYKGTDDRKLSLSVLLSDDNTYRGGDLVLHDGGIHRPLTGKPAGACAVFPSFVVHNVEPIEAGVRTSLVIWLRGPRYR